MGLESVELVMEVEDRFRISLPDHECERVRTVADLAALVIAKLPHSTDSCPTAKSFYRLRRLLAEHASVERQSIRPSMRLDRIGVDHRRQWAKLKKAEPAIPNRQLPLRARQADFYISMSFLITVVGVFMIGIIAGADAAIISALTIMLAVTLIVLKIGVVNPFLNMFSIMPAHMATVGDLARCITPMEIPAESSGQRLIAEMDVLRIVREITAEQMGKKIDEIKPETDFVKDLGF